MREIKFRGKRKDNGEWAEGFYVLCPDGNTPLIFSGHYRNECDFAIDWERYEVIPETVGQFTGLKDKDGKEIYEGSGGIHHSWGRYIVRMGTYKSYDDDDTYKEHQGFYIDWLDDDGLSPALAEWILTLSFKMNIHDNPELLEGESQCTTTTKQ